MASHVVILDSTFRRTNIKTTPSTYLVDVLEQVCAKLGLDASQYGLKNNNKPVDLSRTFRLSGLPAGAKLELVVVSRSPSVVSVALQIPESEAQDIPNSRLTDKFPSTTTLWQILRRFESGTAGGLGIIKNFTARGIPYTDNGNAGSGRLHHQQPVLHAVDRELSTFIDLQKSLSQLGFNSGSVRLRLSFRTSETPLEEAIEQIGQYFKSLGGDENGSTHSTSVGATESKPDISTVTIPDNIETSKTPPEPTSSPEPSVSINNETRQADPPSETSSPQSTTVGPGQRPISVFAPPSSSTPQSALQPHNEADYEPSIDHARNHLARLNSSGRNQRLLTDAELRGQQESQALKLGEIKEVEIKVRLPDQTQVVGTFTNADTAQELYAFVRNLLETPTEEFYLSFRGDEGVRQVPRNDSKLKLIQDLKIRGRMVVNFLWSDEVAVTERALRGKLKPEYMAQAKQHEIRDVEGTSVVEHEGEGSREGEGKVAGNRNEKGKGKGGGAMLKSLQKHLMKK